MDDLTTSLAQALDRIADFQAVQVGRSPDQLGEAVELLQESVGILDRDRQVIRDHLDEIRGSSAAPGHVLLGIIVGLTAAELAGEEA